LTKQDDGDGGREVHHQVDVLALAVELEEFGAEVRAYIQMICSMRPRIVG